jgi:hypothetical protein
MQIKGSRRKLSVRGLDQYTEASARAIDSTRGIPCFLSGTKAIIKLPAFLENGNTTLGLESVFAEK